MIIDKEYQENAMLLFQGPISVNFISYMGNYLQSLLPQDTAKLQQIFRVFVELTQNVSYYSEAISGDKNSINSGIGWFSFQDLDTRYRLTTGNLIKKEDEIKLTNYCNEINAMTVEGLRKLKREVRSQAFKREVNAQVGIIQIGITSANKIDAHVNKINDQHSFFIISAYLEK